jgi:hypothetical protein
VEPSIIGRIRHRNVFILGELSEFLLTFSPESGIGHDSDSRKSGSLVAVPSSAWGSGRTEETSAHSVFMARTFGLATKLESPVEFE